MYAKDSFPTLQYDHTISTDFLPQQFILSIFNAKTLINWPSLKVNLVKLKGTVIKAR